MCVLWLPSLSPAILLLLWRELWLIYILLTSVLHCCCKAACHHKCTQVAYGKDGLVKRFDQGEIMAQNVFLQKFYLLLGQICRFMVVCIWLYSIEMVKCNEMYPGHSLSYWSIHLSYPEILKYILPLWNARLIIFYLCETPVWFVTGNCYCYMMMMKRQVAEGFAAFVVSSLWTSHSRRD